MYDPCPKTNTYNLDTKGSLNAALGIEILKKKEKRSWKLDAILMAWTFFDAQVQARWWSFRVSIEIMFRFFFIENNDNHKIV